MLRNLSTQLKFLLRNVRGKRITEDEPADKLKFSEQELTEMGTYKTQRKTRNVIDLINDKLQSKTNKQAPMQDEEYQPVSKGKGKQNDEDQQPSDDNDTLDEKLLNRSYEMKATKDRKEKFKTFKIYNKAHPRSQPQPSPQQQLETEAQQLASLSRVRLAVQYLPYEYMRRVQKVFHKYDQTQLRDIALHFGNLMRLRYSQEKIDYEQYTGLDFQKLQDRLPHSKKIEPLYLTSKDKTYESQANSRRKIDDEPIDPEISYTQNIIVSYLLNRVPRTYAVAKRIISEIKAKYPTVRPKSFLDFGSGLSSGSTAFIQTYGETGQIYSVEPAVKMRKMAKYLTSYSGIHHFQTLGELSSHVRQVDIVYCGYVLNQIRPELVTIYLESLYAKTKSQGFLALVEYGNPYGARIIHQARQWALTKNAKIAAPCPHHLKCPLAKSQFWCHFDQPAGMYPREAFGKLPNDNSLQLQKYSYLIIQKLDPQQRTESMLPVQKVEANISDQWDRVLFPLMKKGRHFLFSLCTREGNFDKRIAAKSHGLEYKEGRRLRWGDLWRFGQRIPNRYRKQRKTGKRLW